MARTTVNERLTVIVIYEGFQLLDLAGPADVLRAATLLGAARRYRIVVVSPDGRPVRSDSGIAVAPDASLAALARNRRAIDCLLVVGGLGVRQFVADAGALAHLRRLSGRARRTTSVCTGALALAAAGLLDGYRATTHWASCEQLAAQHPA
ncbi:MAG TPA: DJ-1/PfpI family protein, partial [Acidimicrobiales bacterium]|nr:DJ-1/PfpI family protein [Acidimicrobiales bacterium]